MFLLLLNYVVLRALWKIDVHLISTLVKKSIFIIIILYYIIIIIMFFSGIGYTLQTHFY